MVANLFSKKHYFGKKPVAAFGNSDGDLQMLQFAASNNKKSLLLFIHHTDSIREWRATGIRTLAGWITDLTKQLQKAGQLWT